MGYIEFSWPYAETVERKLVEGKRGGLRGVYVTG